MSRTAVTGATGTFGRAFVRRVLDKGAERVVVVSRDEMKQGELMAALGHYPALRCFLGDVRDRRRLTQAFHGCDTTVHAAALKQVQQGVYNTTEMVATNCGGTQNVIEAALDVGATRMLLLSSDKAVMPASLYGASKLLAEHLTMGGSVLGAARGLRCSAVRYGNVINSRGSVVPAWRAAAARGEPLWLTDRRMSRFWLTVEQAVSLAQSALKHMEGGEIFIPDVPGSSLEALVDAIAPGATLEEKGWRIAGEHLVEYLLAPDEVLRTRRMRTWWRLPGEAVYAVIPSYHPWREKPPWEHLPLVDPEFVYGSDRVRQLTVEELRAMAEEESR